MNSTIRAGQFHPVIPGGKVATGVAHGCKTQAMESIQQIGAETILDNIETSIIPLSPEIMDCHPHAT